MQNTKFIHLFKKFFKINIFTRISMVAFNLCKKKKPEKSCDMHAVSKMGLNGLHTSAFGLFPGGIQIQHSSWQTYSDDIITWPTFSE